MWLSLVVVSVVMLRVLLSMLPSTPVCNQRWCCHHRLHSSPPVRSTAPPLPGGGWGGGRAAHDFPPHDRPSHTPRNARFLGRLREPFPETFQPPPNPPLAGGELVLRTLGSFWEAL